MNRLFQIDSANLHLGKSAAMSKHVGSSVGGLERQAALSCWGGAATSTATGNPSIMQLTDVLG